MTTTTDLLTTDAAARYLVLSRRALYQRIRRGQIPVVRLGRSIRIRRASLDAVMGAERPNRRRRKAA